MSSAVRFYLSADRRSIGLFRFVLGLLLAADVISRFGLVASLYSNEGVLTNHFALFRPVAAERLSLFFAFSLASDVRWLLLLTVATIVAFAVGYRTCLTGALAFALVVSLHARNQLALLPSDSILHGFLLWSLLLPLADRFSYRRLVSGALAAPREGELRERSEPLRPFTSLAVLGVQLWVVALHVLPTLRRSGPAWRDGDAWGYALADSAWSSEGGSFVARHAPEAAMRAMSYVEWLTPLAFAVLWALPFSVARRIALALLVALHASTAVLFRDALSELVLCAAAPLLLTARDWEVFCGWRAQRRRALSVIYDSDCGVCLVICRFVQRLDVYRRLRILPNDSSEVPASVSPDTLAMTVVVIGDDGSVSTKSAAVAAVIAALPGGRLPAWLLTRPRLRERWDRAYDAFAQRRATISQWLGFGACGVGGPHDHVTNLVSAPPAPRTRAWVREAATLLLAVLCARALAGGSETSTGPSGGVVVGATRYLGLVPSADRLAPEPPRSTGALVVDGVTASGAHLDPLSGRPPQSSATGRQQDGATAPALMAYFERVHEPARAVYLEGLRDYVKHESSAAGTRVSAFDVWWVTTPVPWPPGNGGESSQRKLVSFP